MAASRLEIFLSLIQMFEDSSRSSLFIGSDRPQTAFRCGRPKSTTCFQLNLGCFSLSQIDVIRDDVIDSSINVSDWGTLELSWKEKSRRSRRFRCVPLLAAVPFVVKCLVGSFFLPQRSTLGSRRARAGGVLLTDRRLRLLALFCRAFDRPSGRQALRASIRPPAVCRSSTQFCESVSQSPSQAASQPAG